MRKILIADDERTIREGIKSAVDWNSLGISEVLTAADGKSACDIIEDKNPDIAIVDIIMPEMTGIEIISHFKKRGGGPEFVIISGYGEFDYAQEALRNEVNNYILKPCDINEITETLIKIIKRLDGRSVIEKERRQMKEHLILLMPQAREQIFRDYVTGVETGADSLDLLRQMLGREDCLFRLLLFDIGERDNYSKLVILKKCVDGTACLKGWRYSVILNGCVVIALDPDEKNVPDDILKSVRNDASRHNITEVRASVSRSGDFDSLPEMYRETQEAVKFAFLFDDGELVTAAPLIDASAPHRCKVVKKIMQYVNEHYCDSSLTLGYIASNVLYLNVDYMGKLFKKECGVKFSDYLMSVRMEKAKHIIAETGDIRVYEIAQQVGLGDNSAYFSNNFRKYTGMLPTEYRTSHTG